MIKMPEKPIVFFDVNGTLVLWDFTEEQKEKEGLFITCPPVTSLIDGKEVTTPSWSRMVVPEKGNIEALKEHKTKGHTVVVWTSNSTAWAESVINALNLERFVDIIMSKPHWIYDDLSLEEFMPKPSFVK